MKSGELPVWPDTLRIRDTGLFDDMGGAGQRIYTTAGQGYQKTLYIRKDLYDAVAEQMLAALGNKQWRYVMDGHLPLMDAVVEGWFWDGKDARHGYFGRSDCVGQWLWAWADMDGNPMLADQDDINVICWRPLDTTKPTFPLMACCPTCLGERFGTPESFGVHQDEEFAVESMACPKCYGTGWVRAKEGDDAGHQDVPGVPPVATGVSGTGGREDAAGGVPVVGRRVAPKERYFVSPNIDRYGGRGFRIGEVVGISSQDIPEAQLKVGDRLTISFGWYETEAECRAVVDAMNAKEPLL